MGYLLVKFYSNWADEFDVEGSLVIEEKEFKKFKKVLKENQNLFPLYYSFGTNQEIEFEDFEELFDCYETKKINENEFKSLKKLKLLKIGFIGPIDDCEDYYNEEFIEETNKNKYNSTLKKDIANIKENKFNDKYIDKIKNGIQISLSSREVNEEELSEEIKYLKSKNYICTYEGKYGSTWELNKNIETFND